MLEYEGTSRSLAPNQSVQASAKKGSKRILKRLPGCKAVPLTCTFARPPAILWISPHASSGRQGCDVTNN